MQIYRLDHALLPEGMSERVRVDVADGRIVDVVIGGPALAGEVAVRGLVLLGMANVHSHAFQRAMAGLAEWDAGGKDNFWSWREAMYRFFAYPFLQVGCTRVTGLVAANNQVARAFDEHIGFVYEGTLRRGMPDGTDLTVYGMLRDECRWIKR